MNSDIANAVEILKRGGLVAFPTETVYGLGADATNPAAIEKIFAAKGRPSTNPLIVHVADIATAKKFAADWPESAQKLAEKFWPGSLTFVVPKSSAIAPQVTAGKSTVGLRVPNHPLALELLKAFAGPLAAPSANRSTHVSPTQASHVRDDLGEAVDLVLDGGPCEIGIESTVLDLTMSPPTILRPGAITPEQIESIIGRIRIRSQILDPSIAASSPGQHAIHYAPRAAAYRFESSEFDRVREWRGKDAQGAIVKDSVVVTVGPNAQIPTKEMPATPSEYAQELYATLRMLDQCEFISIIFIEMPPNEPAWFAIRDRLLRATRPFPPPAQ